MEPVPDCFAVLGLAPTASPLEVKKAYRRLVARWHPDRFTHDPVRQRLAQERLKEINAAHAACLSAIGQRRQSFWGITAGQATPPAQPKPRSRPVSAQVSPGEPSPVVPPLAAWPNGALAAVLALGWLMGIHRYGFGGDFLRFMGLLALLPAIAAVWYNARWLGGRVMLLLYVCTIAGAGLYLLVSQSLYEQRVQTVVPSWPGSGAAEPVGVGGGSGRGVAAERGPDAFSPMIERPPGPMAPQVPAPEAPAAPLAPAAPAAPLAPLAR
jgi:hypothetical protein